MTREHRELAYFTNYRSKLAADASFWQTWAQTGFVDHEDGLTRLLDRIAQAIADAEQRATLAERERVLRYVSAQRHEQGLMLDAVKLGQAIERGDHLADSKGDET